MPLSALLFVKNIRHLFTFSRFYFTSRFTVLSSVVVSEGQGECIVAGEGTVIFEFDNSTSIFREMKVGYSFSVFDLD
jgi:hypothetical protein